MRSLLLAAAAFSLVLTGCSGRPETGPARPAAPKLADPRPCAGQPGFTCSTLTVPLDHHGRAKGELKLQVATADNAKAPKGVLLFLTGGPGQPGVPYITRMAERLPEVARTHRLVMLDQRGTGASGAIRCPELQAQVGGSDIEAPTRDAVDECAGILGERRHHYTTDQTVADLDLLRRALGVRAMAVDGVSYGSFTAARYAAAHPRHVSRVVLDSVVPHVDPQNDDMLYPAGLRATARVLRDACEAAPACGFDPAEDLATVAGRRADRVRIWDMLVTYGFSDPTYRDPNPPGLPRGSGDAVAAVHEAAGGDPARLDRLLRMTDSGGEPVAEYSSGLHIATACGDGRFPWGTSESDPATRADLLARTVKALPRSATWPFPADTVAGGGFIRECLHWPTARHGTEPADRRLPDVPVLIVHGDRDLSTPLEWAREQLGNTPRGRLVVVKGAYHSIQSRERGDEGRRAVTAFLNG